MAENSFDIQEILLRMRHPLMRRIAELRGCATDCFDRTFNDYAGVLESAGRIAGQLIAPAAAAVDREGACLADDGRVVLAEGTRRGLEAMHEAGFSGLSLPEAYGGRNMPYSVFCAVSEILSRADASFQNVWGLQSCAAVIYESGTDEQKEKYLRMVCDGCTMSMDLTEPDAGSDLQNVRLRADWDGDAGCWRLNGVKRFITNGDSDIHLVLARSEEGTTDGRGLSLFIYDKRDGGAVVTHVEDKMGIHGSPTCRLTFRNARAELLGERRLGLIKYVMSVLNGARVGIAAQSVGISDAAWRRAVSYAAVRVQSGQTIDRNPAVYQMLAVMKARLEASRSLLYATVRHIDIAKTSADRAEARAHSRLADALTPLLKAISSEFANQNTYDCIQVHGGNGYIRGAVAERLYRDARVTSIYEGTTQIQVSSALRYVMDGTYSRMTECGDSPALCRMRELLDSSVAAVSAMGQPEMTAFCARRLVETAAYAVMGSLLAQDAAAAGGLLSAPLAVFLDWALAGAEGNYSYISSLRPESLALYR